MLNIKSFEFNPFGENTYVISDESGECIIIDPGCYDNLEKTALKKYITEKDLKVVELLNTHCHIDHVFGNKFVRDTFKVDFRIHELDLPTLEAVKVYAPVYGFSDYEEANPDGFFEEGDTITFGNTSMEILFVPGHAPGHVVFINREENICIGGDVLFRESIGRTDLPGGDHDLLINNIQEKMFALNENMVVYPGHGPVTTIGHEKMHNPFCATITR